MRKNKVNVLIVLGLFFLLLILVFGLAQLPVKKMLASAVQGIEREITFLKKQLNNLVFKINNLINKKDGGVESDLLNAKPPILSNLEPEHVTDSSVIITWETDELSDSMVNYSDKYVRKGTETDLIATNSSQDIFHTVKLEFLEPNIKYYYYVSSTDSSGNTSVSNVHSITTLP